jgi:hypothetical protein
MRPNWHLLEPLIRGAAGLGRVSKNAWLPRSESRFGNCDVRVVGAEPAGPAAAIAELGIAILAVSVITHAVGRQA